MIDQGTSDAISTRGTHLFGVVIHAGNDVVPPGCLTTRQHTANADRTGGHADAALIRSRLKRDDWLAICGCK